MKGKAWGGTIRGQNGVFNPHLTDQDLALIRRHMREPAEKKRPIIAPDPITMDRQKALFRFYEKDVEHRILKKLADLGLEIYRDPKSGKDGRQYSCEVGRIDLLCTTVDSGQFVIIELKKGQAPNETLLQILRYMSWVRQHLGGGKEVKGIILTESADSDLEAILGEVPNVSIRYYKISVELVSTPSKSPKNPGSERRIH